jgi:hypothetical protein
MKLTKNILAVLVGVSLGLGGTAFAVTNVSLTKNRALQYLNYIADSFLIGGTATTSDARLSVVGSTTVTGTGIFGGELRVPYFTATSTSATSTIASMLRVSNYALDSAGLRAIQAPTYITTETSSAGGNANAPDVIIKPGDGLGSGRGGEINLMPGFSDPLGSGPLGDGPRNGNITITNLLGGSFATLDVDGIRGSYTTHFPFEDATVTSRFIRLTDAPQDYTSHANKLVGVLADESGLEFKFLNFINLADVTNTYSGAANYLVAVRPDESGLEFIANPGSASSTLLGDGNHWSVTQYLDSLIANASSTIQLLMTNNATSTNFETTNLKVGTLTGLLKASNGGVTTATVGSDYQAPLGAGTKGQILGYLGTGVPTWVATTTFSAPLVFSAGNVTCTTASSGVAGCLSNTSFDTFNGKESALTFGSLLTRAANVITGSSSPSFAFLNATSTDYASYIKYASSTSITTTASSTLGDIISSGLSSFNRLLVTGAGTSTKLSGSLSVASAIDSGTATSTFFGLQSTNGMRVLSLASCDTVDTDASGNFKCGADATGGASSGFIVNATGTPGQMAAFSAINTLVSTSTINIAQIDATSTLIASRFPYASTTAITTTATSTMGDIYSSAGLLSYARLNVTGAGTSTILTGALEALNFQMTGTATSTAAGGINITAGCFAVKGVCVGGGSAALTGGESGSFAYWTSASTLAATSSPVFPYFTATSTTATSTVKWRFSVGTSTSNEINFMPDVVGTSTFTSGYGLDLTNGGCYAIGGACVSGVLSVGGSNNDMMFKTGAQAISGSTGVSFAWDNTNKRLGIGSSTPYAQLTVGGDIWTGGLRASSTVMFGSNSTAFLWNSTNGHVGINGTTTPWGDLSIVASDDTPPPAFVGATTTGGITSWFWNSTSTKATNPFNWMFGTSSNRYNRNSFLVAGEVRSTFQNYTCEPYNALTADITADSPTITTSASQLCGGLMFDELTDGALYIATTSPIIASGRLISQSPMWAIRANELTTAAANEGYAIRMPRNIIGASSTPYLEVMVRKQVVQPAAVTNASSTLGFVGFETGALNATTRCGDGAGSIGCMGFVSSSTGNWMALTSSRTGVQTGTLTDTGVSSTTAGFINMRIEVENSGNRVKYLMRHTGADEWRLVAEHATNIPTLEVTPAIVIDADAASGARPDILGKGPIYWGYSVNGSTGY